VEAIEGEVVETNPTKKPRKKRRDRTVRDKLFVDEYFRNGGNATKAALAMTGSTTRDAAKTAGYQLKKRNMEDIQTRMEKFGLTDKKIMTKHAELVDSQNDAIAMKAVETFYKYTKQEGGSDGNVTIHFNF
jgi:5-bromo-4-chloroindolyl phosphate hydrolysis protein